MDADTVNRELSIARKAIGWWQRQGWIEGDPTIGIERRPAPPDRTKALADSQITAKGGATEWIHWQSGTTQLLPRLIGRRTRGPLFLTDRKAPAGTPTLDVCPETGRARLSYRRTEETFEENTRLPADPLASPEDIEDLGGWMLHRLRHSALTHDAEGGTSTPMFLAIPMLLARSRHASVRFLERYVRPVVDAVARHVAESDPATRRRR
ncbi:site-specific integrase [Streptomyces mirabilis]|uniref:site-specific integrase n=1 Tax=Streptomyces sp. NPDC005388 TaxID=3156717 RepID=UPI0033BA6183